MMLKVEPHALGGRVTRIRMLGGRISMEQCIDIACYGSEHFKDEADTSAHVSVYGLPEDGGRIELCFFDTYTGKVAKVALDDFNRSNLP